ncbi:glutamyl-tRNA reductase [Glaciecola sp. 1036]|uniref:glutamyl-tRNA reductase n=1 Tax=Alteromonadaceae TaxID=72275 RepID=UPI003D08A17F
MSFLSIGVNHTSAPVALREKVAFTPDKLIQALSEFSSKSNEIVILSTCNRTEVYVAGEMEDAAQLVDWLAKFHQLDVKNLSEHIYHYGHVQSVQHLMRVATGLDSLILGEPQILGQVKQAYNEAKRVGTVGPQFEKLFQTTFAVAKQVRSETEIGANAVSVAFAAVQLAKQIFSAISKSNILLVGAGETIELVGRHLKDANAKTITVANRTLERASDLADKLDGKAISISQVPAHLAEADVVISSTASSLPLIGTGMVSTALKQRRHKPMLLIDLAVPRDIENEVADLDDAYLYTVDDLQDIIEQNLANREQAAKQASEIITQKSIEFSQWLEQAEQVDLIRSYRGQSEDIKQKLVEKSLQALEKGANAEDVLNELANKLSKQLMHGPTKAFQTGIKNGDQALLDVLKSTLISESNNK